MAVVVANARPTPSRELARRALEGGRLPQTGGVRPQLAVVVDLDSLQGHPSPSTGGLGGHTDLGALDPAGCRRLACDGAVTRVLVTRHPTPHHREDPGGHRDHGALGGGGDGGLAARLQTAAALPPDPGRGPPASPWTSAGRVVQPGQRTALAVRDRGGVVPGCQRPWPGATPIICSTGWTAARPTWPTRPCCVGPTIGPSTRAAGN
jgi:hypothetical protein